jgi:hypothetical protein
MKIPDHILAKVKGFFQSIRTKFLSIFNLLDGTLTVTKVYPDGSKEKVFKKTNLITTASKVYIINSIYKSTFTLNIINRLQVGIGGTVDPAGLYPKTVNGSLTTLFSPLLAVNTYYTEDNTIPLVTFIADVDQTMANGSLVTEAGLLFTNGNLFNIKTFPGIPKTADFSIHFEWTIKLA